MATARLCLGLSQGHSLVGLLFGLGAAALATGCGSADDTSTDGSLSDDNNEESDGELPSEENNGEDNSSDDVANAEGEEAAGLGGEDELNCEGPGFEIEVEPSMLLSLTARVVDQHGDPASEILAQACGLDVCINSETNGNGEVAIDAEAEMLMPAFKHGLGIRYAKFALPLTDETVELGEVTTVLLPTEGEELAPGQTVKSNGVTIRLAEETDVSIDRLTYTRPETQGFRAEMVSLEQVGLDPSIELAFALAPVETTFCPAVELSVPNVEGWEAGTEVEFLVHGVTIEQEWAPYGGWAVVSGGVVTDDGSVVQTTDGLPTLSVVGIRRR